MVMEIEVDDDEAPKASSSDTSSGKESATDSESPTSNGLPSWIEPFEGKSTIPAGLVWCTCDLSVEECRVDICKILMGISEKDEAVIIITPDFLRWLCCPPGYLPSLHIGIWDSSLGKVVAFIAAVPSRVRVMKQRSRIAWIHFPAIQNDFRHRIPRKIIRSELLRRVYSENIRWLVRKKLASRPGLMAFPAWGRVLNSRTLFDIGFINSTVLTLGEMEESFKLPLSADDLGFKVMDASHVQPLTSLLNTYLRKFKIALEFDEAAVRHLFLSSANFVRSYVYVGPDENITGFCSFVILRESFNGVLFTSACSFYNFTVGMSFQKLLIDALVLALENQCDLFIAYDIMGIGDLLTHLRFHQMKSYYEYEFCLGCIRGLTKDDIGLPLL